MLDPEKGWSICWLGSFLPPPPPPLVLLLLLLLPVPRPPAALPVPLSRRLAGPLHQRLKS